MSLAFEVRVEGPRCTRCGACAAMCRQVFDLSAGACRVARQPNADERVLVDAARCICPTDAIRVVTTRSEESDDEPCLDATAVSAEPLLFGELATSSESVRWGLDGVPWKELDSAQATPELRNLVRAMAFSENATYTATQRFLEAFVDDVDFSQWVAVWFYEETRHPHVLLEWLRRVGENLPADFVSKGRVSTPFMRSLTGTLVTNVISEITASQAYRHLAARSSEPLLRKLALRIAGDEARHAASFFRFARRRLALASADDGRRDRARGLEVLQAWLGDAAQTTHPVAQMIERLGGAQGDRELDQHLRAIRARVVHVIGLLLDLPIRAERDVAPALRSVLAHGRDVP